MPKPGYFDGTEAQVVLEPSSFARELAASARSWADAKRRGGERGGDAAASTTATAAGTHPEPPPPFAEARGRDPRSALPGGWVRVRVVDSCTASGPEGGLRFCVEVATKGEKEKRRRRRRFWLPLAWLHPSGPNPVLALRPPHPSPAEGSVVAAELEPSWSAGDEAEVRKRGEGGETSTWWPATILRVEEGGGEGEAGGGAASAASAAASAAAAAPPPPRRTLVVRIEPCCCYPTGAVVSVPCSPSSPPSSHLARPRPPLPPLFEEEAARLQLEQERAERSGRLGGGHGSRGGVLGSGRRWGGVATSFGESVHPEEWKRRTAGLLVEEVEAKEREGEGEKKKGGGDGGDGGGGKQQTTAAAAGPSAGVSSGARTHLIAGFSMEAALCPGQLSTAREEEEEEEGGGGEEEEEGGEEEDKEEAAAEGQPKEKKRRKTPKTTLLPLGYTNRDPFGYDETARALLEAGGSL